MKTAMAEAEAAFARGEIPVGAVVTHGGVVIARGANDRRAASAVLSHAETAAIDAACRALGRSRLDGCELYVTLEPCPMCAGAITQARIARVVFGAADPRAGAAGSLYDILRDPRNPHRCVVASGVMARESGELLQKFFGLRRSAARMKRTEG